jgi:hypothetical protein
MRFIAIGTALCAILAVTAPAVTAQPVDKPLFADHAVLKVTIDAPFTTLMDVRPDEAYLKGSFTFTDLDGAEKRVSLKLRTRGNYRRTKDHCDFAPIRLNFVKSEVKGTLFDGQDKLKLVTHCKSWEPGYEELVFREYLAYRLYQVLSDASYRVRLLDITYFDTQKQKEQNRFGFVIEDDNDVEDRTGLELVKVKRLEHQYYDPASANLVNLFEYMIGNTEYSLVNPEPGKKCCHNTDVLSATGGPPYVSLPFDFDFSGLVDAPYAEPNPKYPIQDVRRRYYRGQCGNNDELPQTIGLFQAKRDEIFEAIESLATASSDAARAAKSARNYVATFYKVIDKPENVRKRLLDQCQPPDE